MLAENKIIFLDLTADLTYIADDILDIMDERKMVYFYFKNYNQTQCLIMYLPSEKKNASLLYKYSKLTSAQNWNQYLNGLLLGYSNDEIKQSYDAQNKKTKNAPLNFDADKQSALNWIAENEKNIDAWVNLNPAYVSYPNLERHMQALFKSQK